MPEKPTLGERIVKATLEGMGFRCSRIPTSDGKRCDFLVEADTSDDKYLFEVKERFDDPSESARRKDVLSRGEMLSESKPLGYSNTIAGRADGGIQQLQGVTLPGDCLRMFWYHIRGTDEETGVSQVRSTLLGSKDVADLDRHDCFPCYFLSESVFFRHRQWLDGAVVSSTAGAHLITNPLSRHYEQLLSSRLLKAFGDAVLDPIARESQKKAYLADFVGDRRDENAILAALAAKYGAHKMIAFDMHAHSVSTLIPRDAIEQEAR